MALFLPKKVPLNWYYYDVSFSIELMKGYVEGVEIQATEMIKNYEKEKQQVISEEVSDEGHASVIEHFQGLDDETWDLNGIFKEYFPSLQRSSALVSLFGFFENELNQLCDIYKNNKSLKIGFKDLNGQGIERAGNFLEKVVRLDIQKESKQWREIKNIQKIRNLIVHLNGKLIDINGAVKQHEKDYVLNNAMLKGEDEVIVLKGDLMHVLNNFNEYFQLLNVEIKKHENV